MADTNPGNFANRPKEEVQAIASMGGKAAHEKVPPFQTRPPPDELLADHLPSRPSTPKTPPA